MFFVKCKWLSDDLNASNRKRQSAKKKRAQMSKRIQKEKQIHEKAKEELCQFECHEFDSIHTIFKTGKEYCFKDFLQMLTYSAKHLCVSSMDM